MSASAPPRPATASDLPAQLTLIATKRYRVGIIGLGYVGIPLALTACKAGFPVVGFDIDAQRVAQINRGESFIKHIPTEAISAAIKEERFRATTNFDELRDVDAIIIAVPTPLTKHREPDLSYVENTARTIAPRLRKGHLVVLESTTWPGTTDEIMRPIFEQTGLKSGKDFYLAFSPEREDPGNPDFGTSTIPKVVGGDGPDALALANAVYGALVVKTVPVSSSATAEAVKLTENIFRAVNIALVNELKVIYGKMGIDIWEVIDAAKTKPFGFMPFYPGPGLGGHCIPIDPFYLTWKAREFDVTARFIELAGEINTAMPHWVVDRVAEALDRRQGRGLNGARVLVMGIAYKKNIEDTRESPALKLIELLEERGATADYHDPYVPELPRTRKHGSLAGRASVPLTAEIVARYDAVLIATDHEAVDYPALVEAAQLVIDTRNACARAGITHSKIIKA
ncbi:nucleotide sugar dehydrogenase [Bosea sp. ASV33]|uniref:nucleotide sugar dehydrogenase n=1 Tax=Bosea sp. ASV33 TaxID=2795106 RepID=UPI0018EB6F26|nr:nucleotide sugar dehydrogenase [Bosea sp. ASV33]